MMLETTRLKLIPLSFEQVEKFRQLNNELEDELGLNRFDRELTERYKDALQKYTLEWIRNDPVNILFATVWIMVEKESNSIAGDIGFKRKADVNGNIEIGYSVQPKFRRKGYATEAIGELCKWAFTHSEVFAILAETLEDNEASIKALKNNGFIEVKHTREDNLISSNNTHSESNMTWHILTKYHLI